MSESAERAEGVVRRIAWRRAVPDHDFMRRWSLQHLIREEEPRTLCGVQPRFALEGPGDARRCHRCERINGGRFPDDA